MVLLIPMDRFAHRISKVHRNNQVRPVWKKINLFFKIFVRVPISNEFRTRFNHTAWFILTIKSLLHRTILCVLWISFKRVNVSEVICKCWSCTIKQSNFCVLNSGKLLNTWSIDAIVILSEDPLRCESFWSSAILASMVSNNLSIWYFQCAKFSFDWHKIKMCAFFEQFKIASKKETHWKHLPEPFSSFKIVDFFWNKIDGFIFCVLHLLCAISN